MYHYELLGGGTEHNFRKTLFIFFLCVIGLLLVFQLTNSKEEPVSKCLGSVTVPTVAPQQSTPLEQTTSKPTVAPQTSTSQEVTTPKPTKHVWDTMDGEGYQFSENNGPIVLDERYEKLNNLPACGDLAAVQVKPDVLEKVYTARKEFLDCINPIVAKYKGKPKEMILDWVAQVEICDKLPVFESLGVVPFENLHETKWAVLPKCKEENNLLTLGVGHDTIAEEKFNRTVPNTKFYGADPIIEPNRQMYSAFGKFFPFAIGKQPGFTKFRVLPNQNQKTRAYVFQDVTTIPFLYFVKDILKFKRIDFAWIDIEGGEFEFLDQLHNDITICQFNIEVHMKFRKEDGAEVFSEFIFKVLENQKYIFMKSLYTDVGVHRMFFINVQSPECLAKFFGQWN
ncbi:hypothetical protein CAEBREN_25516 [Caenorhabditis brenneri]|uniref:Methyltransferase FkbM domain-containing protein n=1 Tax=Caenorhabditis brenneri TaxID=135651 RepID=G0MYY1_CAEBE|nr:hypothetical protein CAEBREN_25516 [Caenorhabditis brenneri]